MTSATCASAKLTASPMASRRAFTLWPPGARRSWRAHRTPLQSKAMSTLGKTIVVKGELRTAEDLTIEGRLDGSVFGEGIAVVVAESGHFTGDVIARDVTIVGRATGRFIATDVVDVRQ